MSRTRVLLSLALALATGIQALAVEQPVFEAVAKEHSKPDGSIELLLTLNNRSQRSIEGVRVEVTFTTSGGSSGIHVIRFPDGVDTSLPQIPLPGTIGLAKRESYVVRVAWIRFSDGSELTYPSAAR